MLDHVFPGDTTELQNRTELKQHSRNKNTIIRRLNRNITDYIRNFNIKVTLCE